MEIFFKINIFKSIRQYIENYKKKTYEGIDFLWETAFKGGLFGLILASIIWSSIFLYVMFYYLYMPSLSHIRPVHLQFTPCEYEKGICSFPSAHVQLTKKQQLLMIGQKYKIFLSLEMPESPANVGLGMFMVCARMVDKDSILVSNSCRSTMLHYRSQVLKFMLTIVNIPFLIFGSKEEKQILLVELYSDFEDRPNHPVTDIYVEVQSRYIELYSATLQVDAHLSGLRYLMFHWPLLSSIIGISSNFFVTSFIFSMSWYHLFVHYEYGRKNILHCVKRTLTIKPFKYRDVKRKDYIEEIRPIRDKLSDSSSENEESKSGLFNPGTSEDLDYFLDPES